VIVREGVVTDLRCVSDVNADLVAVEQVVRDDGPRSSARNPGDLELIEEVGAATEGG
jgi:hypothetical protein